MHNFIQSALTGALAFLSVLLMRQDIVSRRLPNPLNAAFLLVAVCARMVSKDSFLPVFGVLLCLVVPLWLIAWHGYRRGRITIGMGDVKLMAGLSVWQDTLLVPILCAAALSAAAFITIRRVISGTSRTSICLAPFLLGYAWLFNFCRAAGLL